MPEITYSLLLGKIAPVFLLLLLGMFLRRARVLTAEADQSLMRVTIQLLYPALILRFVLGNPALREATNLWLAPLVGVGTVTLGFAVAGLASRGLRSSHPRTRGTFAFTTGIFNYGYIPIPIALALFGAEGNSTVAVLLLHNVGVEIAFWTLGILILTAGTGQASWKRIFNPPVITLAGALVLNRLGLDTRLPAFFTDTIRWLSDCTVPIGLIISGATLADLVRTESGLLKDFRTPSLAVLIRLGLLPLGFLALARFLPGATDELRRVIVIQAAMPAGIFPLVVTRYYGGDSRTALFVVIATTLAGLVTIPLWIQFGLTWVFP